MELLKVIVKEEEEEKEDLQIELLISSPVF